MKTKTMPTILRTILILAAVVALPASLGAIKKPKADHAISIKDGRFLPAVLTIRLNQTVEWSNDDNRDHRLVGEDGAFDSGKLKPDDTYMRRFNVAGTFNYACALHPREKGKIIVKKP